MSLKMIYSNKKYVVTKEYIAQTNTTQKLEYFVYGHDGVQYRVFSCRKKAINWANAN